VADVGDGLCIAIRTIFGDIIQIDCGSQQGGKKAYLKLQNVVINLLSKPDIFILSHFHTDHYNGILYASSQKDLFNSFNLNNIYCPKISEFPENKEFLKCLFAINLRSFGNESGLMEYDFIQAIRRLNNNEFYFTPLRKGDKIIINGSTFDVLWPPLEITDDALAIVKKAITVFHNALEEDDDLRKLYDIVSKSESYHNYFGEKIKINPIKNQLEKKELKFLNKDIPEIVKNANKHLRSAANYFSLALNEDNRFLFLGDIDNNEINKVIDTLINIERDTFYIMINPHHGTRWASRLMDIRCYHSISSIGPNLITSIKTQYKKRFNKVAATYINGDILLEI
jgi:beta-lactamase superfamily II metal-dependent hydrolase